MFTLNNLNETHLDFFRELENIGASHAATALSSLLGGEISIRLPRVQFYSFRRVCELVGGPETLTAAFLVEMSGGISGCILLMQKAGEALELSRSVLSSMGLMDEPGPDDSFSDMELSAMQEVSNILSGSYVTAVSDLTGFAIECSVPHVAIDFAASIMSLPAAMYGDYGDTVLFMETQFFYGEKDMSGHFFLMPDISSFGILMDKMDVRHV